MTLSESAQLRCAACCGRLRCRTRLCSARTLDSSAAAADAADAHTHAHAQKHNSTPTPQQHAAANRAHKSADACVRRAAAVCSASHASRPRGRTRPHCSSARHRVFRPRLQQVRSAPSESRGKASGQRALGRVVRTYILCEHTHTQRRQRAARRHCAQIAAHSCRMRCGESQAMRAHKCAATQDNVRHAGRNCANTAAARRIQAAGSGSARAACSARLSSHHLTCLHVLLQ